MPAARLRYRMTDGLETRSRQRITFVPALLLFSLNQSRRKLALSSGANRSIYDVFPSVPCYYGEKEQFIICFGGEREPRAESQELRSVIANVFQRGNRARRV